MNPDVQAGGAGGETSPFKFFDHFGVEDRESFGGRDEEIGAVLAGIARGPLFVLYGRSGLGKTSLLLAGVFPRLEARGFAPRRIRLAEEPIAELRRTLAQAGGTEKGEATEPAHAERQIVLVLDQFEELFTRFRDRLEVRREAGKLLADALAEGSVARVVLAVREDHLAELKELGPSLGDVLANSFRLQPLTAFGTRQAIVRPLDVAGVGYDEGFVNGVVEELSECAYDPVILQIACSEVYRLAAARPERPVRLTAGDWLALGGGRGVFVRYLARVGVELGEAVGLARSILAEMITAEGTRRIVRLAHLERDLRRTTRADIEATLGVLDVRFRLVRRPEGKDWYELRHDRLVPAVRAWLQADPAFAELQFARALVVQTTAAGAWRTSLDGLVPEAQLRRFVVPNADRMQLDGDAAEMLLRSAVQADEESVVEWAQVLEGLRAGRPAAVLQELLGGASGPMKVHAALAAERLPRLTGEALARCLDLALHDDQRLVRRAAARAWVRHEGWSTAPLDQTLGTRAGRRAAHELLAALAEVSPFPAPLARWRAAAERERFKEVWTDGRDGVWRRVYSAAMTAPAALVWTTLAAPGWFGVVAPLLAPGKPTEARALILASFGLPAYVLALWIVTASVFERNRHLVFARAGVRFRAKPSTLGLVLVPRLVLLVPCAALVGYASSTVGSNLGMWQSVLVGASALAISPLLARWVRCCIAAPPRTKLKAILEALAWAGLCAGPAPVLLVTLAQVAGSSAGPTVTRLLVVGTVLGGAMASFGGFMTGLAQAWAVHEAPLPDDLAPRRCLAGRFAAAGVLAVTLAAVPLTFGDSLPFLARRIELGLGARAHIAHGAWPIYSVLELSGEERPAVLELTASGSGLPVAFIEGEQRAYEFPVQLVVARARLRIATLAPAGELSAVRQPMPALESAARPTTSEWGLLATEVDLSAGSADITLEGRLAAPYSRVGESVLVEPLVVAGAPGVELAPKEGAELVDGSSLGLGGAVPILVRRGPVLVGRGRWWFVRTAGTDGTWKLQLVCSTAGHDPLRTRRSRAEGRQVTIVFAVKRSGVATPLESILRDLR